jgi:hypothetical protein
VAISTGTTTTTVHLAAGEACMDRDFILTLRLPQAPPDTLYIDQDLENGWVALASFVPQLPSPQKLPPKSIKIVVDCSGSIAYPELLEQERILVAIFSFNEKLSVLQQEHDKLISLKHGLMHDLLTGTIRVSASLLEATS